MARRLANLASLPLFKQHGRLVLSPVSFEVFSPSAFRPVLQRRIHANRLKEPLSPLVLEARLALSVSRRLANLSSLCSAVSAARWALSPVSFEVFSLSAPRKIQRESYIDHSKRPFLTDRLTIIFYHTCQD